MEVSFFWNGLYARNTQAVGATHSACVGQFRPNCTSHHLNPIGYKAALVQRKTDAGGIISAELG